MSFDHHITVFSPQGHLYQIEYAIKAANSTGNTAIAVRGKNSSAFIAQRKVPDRLIDATSLSNIFKITDEIGCLMIGLSPDCQSQVTRIRHEAQEFWFNNGYSMPVHLLTRRIADIAQVSTQEASGRAMAVIMLFIGVDDEKGAQVFKVDPAGHYLPYKAVAAGKYEPEAMNFLEKKVDELSQLDMNETIEMAIMTMKHVLASDFKSTEVEVAVVSTESKFHILSDAEVEHRINSIAEKSES